MVKIARPAIVLLCLLVPSLGRAEPIVVASKKFTESVILGEIAADLARQAGYQVEHKAELGGSRILFSALEAGEIDVYAEYSGTLEQELLRGQAIDKALAARGIVRSAALGFDNTYALGMRKQHAQALGIRSITDLVRHPDLRVGLSAEFLGRQDGWPGLVQRYGLEHAPRAIDHDLAYRGLADEQLDVIDVYRTDAEIAVHDLVVLADDLHYFPQYQAMWLYRVELDQRAAAFVDALRATTGKLDEGTMRAMNARVRVDGQSAPAAAAGFLGSSVVAGHALWQRLAVATLEHMMLVLSSMLAAVVMGVGTGVMGFKFGRLRQPLLAAVGVLQTIPSLALLVLMIPLFGIGALPAIVALFLYSLLPIVRGTVSGLLSIPKELEESAVALGLGARRTMRQIQLPLALPSIMNGIKTAAVINVGTATLGALIGAGGYGQAILAGIRLDDRALLLEGAIPAAGLALATAWLFDRIERRLVSPGLQ